MNLPWSRRQREAKVCWEQYWLDEPKRRAIHREFVEWMQREFEKRAKGTGMKAGDKVRVSMKSLDWHAAVDLTSSPPYVFIRVDGERSLICPPSAVRSVYTAGLGAVVCCTECGQELPEGK